MHNTQTLDSFSHAELKVPLSAVETGSDSNTNLSELEGRHDHEHESPEAQVQPIAVRQTGVGLPLQQLQQRTDDRHDSA